VEGAVPVVSGVRTPSPDPASSLAPSPLIVRTKHFGVIHGPLRPRTRFVAVNVGAIRNGSFGNADYSSSPSKTLRAAMDFSFYSTGCVKRAKECWNESHTINRSTRAAKTKEKPAGVNRFPHLSSSG
jgi:hypothetical protein